MEFRMGLRSWLFGAKGEPTPDEIFAKMHKQIFPGGQRDVEHLTDRILGAVPGRLSREEARSLGMSLKALLVVAQDKSEDRLLISIRPKTPSLSDADRLRIVQAVARGEGASSAATGATQDTAIVINAANSIEGVDMEYQCLEQMFGPTQPKGEHWTLITRSHGRFGARYLEWFEIQPSKGSRRTVYFDITSFFGK